MPKIIKTYSIEELCNENKQIIINTQAGVSIGLEKCAKGTRIVLYFPNDVVECMMGFMVYPKNDKS